MTREEITSLVKFAKELDRRVTTLRFTQAELSRRTAINGAEVISQGYISDILRVGRGDSKKYFRLQRDKVIRLARAVDWDVDEALDFAGFKSSSERHRADTVEEALDKALFFDQKGLSEADRGTLRPLLTVVDREVERLLSRPSQTKPLKTPTSIIKSNARKRDKIDEAIDNALTKGGLPVSEKNRKIIRAALEKLEEERRQEDE